MPKPIFKKGLIHIGLIVLALVVLTAVASLTISARQDSSSRPLTQTQNTSCINPQGQCNENDESEGPSHQSDKFLKPPDPSKLFLASRDSNPFLCCQVQMEQYWVDYAKIYNFNAPPPKLNSSFYDHNGTLKILVERLDKKLSNNANDIEHQLKMLTNTSVMDGIDDGGYHGFSGTMHFLGMPTPSFTNEFGPYYVLHSMVNRAVMPYLPALQEGGEPILQKAIRVMGKSAFYDTVTMHGRPGRYNIIWAPPIYKALFGTDPPVKLPF